MTLLFLHSKYTLYKLDFTKLWYYQRMSTANDIRIFKWRGEVQNIFQYVHGIIHASTLSQFL